MRIQQNIKSVQLTRQVFVHNMWSGMLIIIAGSEEERVRAGLSPFIAHLYTPGKTRDGVRGQSHWSVPPAGRVRLVHSDPISRIPPFKHPVTLPYNRSRFIGLTVIILVLNPLFSW